MMSTFFQIVVEKSSMKIEGRTLRFIEPHVLLKKLPYSFNKVKLKFVRSAGDGYKFFFWCLLTFTIIDPVNMKTTYNVCERSEPVIIQSQYVILSLDYESVNLNTLTRKIVEDYLNGPLTIPFLVVDLEAEPDVQTGCGGLNPQTHKANFLYFVLSPQVNCSWAIDVPESSYVNIHIPELNLGMSYSSTGACKCSVYKIIIESSAKRLELCGRDIPKNLLFPGSIRFSVIDSSKKQLTWPAVGLTKGNITIKYHIWNQRWKSWGCGKYKYHIPILNSHSENIAVSGKYTCRFMLFSEFDDLGFEAIIKPGNFSLNVSVKPFYAHPRERRYLEPKSNVYSYITSKTEELQISGQGNGYIDVEFRKVNVSGCEDMENMNLFALHQWEKVECYHKYVIRKSQKRCAEEKLQWQIQAPKGHAIQLVIETFKIKDKTLMKFCYGSSALFPVKLIVFNRFMMPYFESCGYHIPASLNLFEFTKLDIRVNVRNNKTLPDDQAGILIHFKYRILPHSGSNQSIYYYFEYFSLKISPRKSSLNLH